MKRELLWSGAAPWVSTPSVYLMTLHVTRYPRPSPSEFAYCKYWKWEQTGNEITQELQDRLEVSALSFLLGSGGGGGKKN